MAASTTGETVRVIVRCRPMNQRELDLKCRTIITMNAQTQQVMLEGLDGTSEPPKQFTFDAVYAENSLTESLYTDSVFPLVESVLEGYNATVFAYGQTGCGKSYTMQGVTTAGSPQRGVIPRSFEHIFDASSVATETKFLIRASYLEIYNESIRDLLGKDVKATLDLKEFVDKGVQVPGLTWHECRTVVDCERLMDKGNKSRATGATLMNKDSSRSHSIFTIQTEMCTRSDLDGKEHIRAGKLNLVDLAGSERQSKTHAEGDRLREATRINLSLSALGNVISALVDGRSKHIPYRDSKLTRLLQDSLGGNTKTLMVAAISPAHDNYEETLSTLRYANRAKNIKNKPRINEDPRDAQMKLLQDEISRLRQELGGDHPNRGKAPKGSAEYDEQIEKEKERLREEFEQQAAELRQQCEAERLTKTELQRKYNELKGQYDQDIESVGLDGQAVDTARGKGKKKNGVNKRKPDGQYENGDGALDPAEKLQRLKELENKLVGGEDANNEERKKKRKKKLNDMRERQEQRTQFSQVIDTNDEDAMMRVFDNAQEELHFLSKRLDQERLEKKRLHKDNDDLQYEFERDRQGYLNTIRVQEQQLLLFRTLLDKMSGTMQRNCNYANIDKIIEQARYDEEKNVYIVADPVREDVQLPHVGLAPTTPNGRRSAHNGAMPDYDYEPTDLTSSIYDHQQSSGNFDELEQRYGRSTDSLQVPVGQLRNRRQEQLLSENTALQNSKLRPVKANNANNDYMNRRLNPFEAPTRLSRQYGFPSDKH